jgi:hypothetical protein
LKSGFPRNSKNRTFTAVFDLPSPKKKHGGLTPKPTKIHQNPTALAPESQNAQ